jgi:hypothetical protein
VATPQEVYDFIVKYINSVDTSYSKWYVGIASDPEKKLFTEHNVSKESGHWIFKDAESEDLARYVEKHIKNNYGTKGGKSGGDETSTSVYAFLTTLSTKE